MDTSDFFSNKYVNLKKKFFLHYYLRERNGSCAPSSNRQSRHQAWVGILETSETAVGATATVIAQIVCRIQNRNSVIRANTSKGVDDVGAQEGVDVLYVKKSITPSVHSPRAIVADHHPL